MEIKFYNQPQDAKLAELLSARLRSGLFSKCYLVAGFAKDSALDYMLEDISYAISKNTLVEMIVGVDKKNTSKDMLLKLLNCGCNIRFHINDGDIKLETRIYIFESENSDSYVYMTGAKFSESGITDNYSIIEEIKYSNSEKIEFAKVKACIENGIIEDDFAVLTEDTLKELAKTGDIMARITERKIPSIGELYSNIGEKDKEISLVEYDESSSNVDYKDLLSKDVEIDFEEDEQLSSQDSFGDEVEHKLKSKKKSDETKVISKIVTPEKAIDYSGMSSLIIMLSKVPSKGVTAGEIKLPASVTSNMQVFFDYPNSFHMEENEKGKLVEQRKVVLDIFDGSTSTQTIDNNAVMIQSDRYTIIKSEEIIKLDINEDDIMRLIKNEDGSYRCEIFKQNSNEYSIWENFCLYQIKNSTKRYGVG